MPRKPYNPAFRKMLLEIVENQLRDNDPPETRATLKRLMAEGRSREQAVELIACVVSCEIFDVLKSNQPFDEDRYRKGLRGLPTLPYDNEEEDDD